LGECLLSLVEGDLEGDRARVGAYILADTIIAIRGAIGRK
jgi:hypothetical protein